MRQSICTTERECIVQHRHIGHIDIFDSLRSLLKRDIKGISDRKIVEMITCIYILALLGIYTEMTEGLYGY